MRQIELGPIGKTTSRIGLGCGRLAGRSSLRQSARLVEAALELGIRYFDVAPSYGMGTAEEVIGEVIGNSRNVVVATKVGIPRPRYSPGAGLARRFVKPLLDRAMPVKALARRLYARSQRPAREPARFEFSSAAIRSSLQESLEKLRRDSVDVLLAHEPLPSDLREEVESIFRGLAGEGLICAYGAGVEVPEDRWSLFGGIWQSGWPGDRARNYKGDVWYIWHGAVRSALGNRSTSRVVRASAAVRSVLEQSPNSILLVSVSTPGQLKELLEEI